MGIQVALPFSNHNADGPIFCADGPIFGNDSSPRNDSTAVEEVIEPFKGRNLTRMKLNSLEDGHLEDGQVLGMKRVISDTM